jgi:DnaK suppressor protein
MDTEHARELLGRERARIEQALAVRTQEEQQGENADDQSPLNRAASLWQDEFDAGQSEDLHAQLAAVERAEARLDAGTYGRSILSGEPIPDERLEVRPAAELTVEEERGRRD